MSGSSRHCLFSFQVLTLGCGLAGDVLLFPGHFACHVRRLGAIEVFCVAGSLPVEFSTRVLAYFWGLGFQ